MDSDTILQAAKSEQSEVERINIETKSAGWKESESGVPVHLQETKQLMRRGRTN